MFTVGSLDRYLGRYIGRLSTDTRPIYRPRVGRESVECRSSVGRLSVECRSIVGRYIGRDVRRPI